MPPKTKPGDEVVEPDADEIVDPASEIDDLDDQVDIESEPDEPPEPKYPGRAGFVDALLFERQGLAARGLDDRVKEVDAQIELYGGSVPKATAADSTPRTTR